jgi:hypothetical protein
MRNNGRTGVALEGEIEGLRAPTAEIKATLEGKAEATTAAPEDSEAEGQRRVTCRRVRVVTAAPDSRDRAALRREQLASDRMKARQIRLTNSAVFNEGDRVWLYCPTRKRGKSPKYHLDQQHGLPGPAHLRAMIIAVRVERLAPYLEAIRDEQP